MFLKMTPTEARRHALQPVKYVRVFYVYLVPTNLLLGGSNLNFRVRFYAFWELYSLASTLHSLEPGGSVANVDGLGTLLFGSPKGRIGEIYTLKIIPAQSLIFQEPSPGEGWKCIATVTP